MTAAVPMAPAQEPTALSAQPVDPTNGTPGASNEQTLPHSPASSVNAPKGNSRGTPSAEESDQMSVAEALAARQALLQDAHDHAAGLETPEGTDPLAVDLTILAQQRELAERAAVLNARAAARDRIAAENASKKSESIDPTATHNLAMVTPLEFMNIPGSDRPVLRPPVTSHVPVVTRNNPAARVRTPPPLPPKDPTRTSSSAKNDAGEQAGDATSPKMRAGRHGTGQEADAPSSLAGSARNPRSSHARTLRRAEEAFQAGQEPAESGTDRRNAKPKNSANPQNATSRGVTESDSEEASPIAAGSAHGLEPLDALTAGLGRANRSRSLVWGSVAVGALALIVGIIMIIIGLSH
ncbi:MAG: hypothetical protein HIU81_12850 [Acidobacteria bacterium]|nr:hypothetical protein [Acidobacteriota bacterium]